MGERNFDICMSATFLGKTYELGWECADYMNLKSLWDSVMFASFGVDSILGEKFTQEVILPWCNEVRVIENESDLMDVMALFEEKKVNRMHFNVENVTLKTTNRTSHLKENSEPNPNSEPKVNSESNPKSEPKENSEPNTNGEPNPNKNSVPNPNNERNLVLQDRQTKPTPPHIIDIVISDSNSDASDGEWSFEIGKCAYESSDSGESKESGQSKESGESGESEDSDDYDSKMDVGTEQHIVECGEGVKSVDGSFVGGDTDNLSDVEGERPLQGSSSDDDDVYIPTPGVPFSVGVDGKIRLLKGQMFMNFRHFREVIVNYAIQEGFRLKRVKNERRRIVCECEAVGCPWMVRGSPTFDRVTYQLKTINDVHTCLSLSKNNQVNSHWIGKTFEREIKQNPGICVKILRQMVLRKCGVQVPAYTLYRAKSFALNIGNEDHKESFNKIHRYGYVLRERNPGTMALVSVLRVNPDPNVPAHFQRFFLSFACQKMGFLEGCRPFIGLDGCHLKGPYGGVLLSAIAMDANAGVYPLAVGVCEVENKETWTWFIALLYEHIGQYDRGRTICFMSDRQKGIGLALDECWPNHRNRFCGRHILQNMYTKHKIDYLKDLFWPAARSPNVIAFTEAMQKIKDVSPAAYKYLIDIPLHFWALHQFDKFTKTDHITNNVVETFNGWVNDARDMPILSMLETIRKMFMTRIRSRYERALGWESNIPPRVMKICQKYQQQGRYLDPLRCGEWEFEVVDGSRQFIVLLDKRTCDCGLWEVTGIPCKHAMACITKLRLQTELETYVDDYLKKPAYLKTYSHVLHGIPDQGSWPQVEFTKLLPPLKTRRKGRPKKSRKRGPTEPPRVQRSVGLRCSICQEIGHNQRTCKGNGAATGKNKQIQGSTSSAATAKRKQTHAFSSSTSGPVSKKQTQASTSTREPRATKVLWFGTSQPSQNQSNVIVNLTPPASQPSQPSQVHHATTDES